MTGHCTPGCGACCRVFALPFDNYKRDVRRSLRGWFIRLNGLTPDYLNFLRLHESFFFKVGRRLAWIPDGAKVRRGTYAGRPVAYVYVPCSALDEYGMCSLYGKPERPEMCAKWPTDRDDLWIVKDQCTYSADAPNP